MLNGHNIGERILIMIAKEGVSYILAALCVAFIVCLVFGPLWGMLPGILCLFLIFFFRNPDRSIVCDERNVLSPADGKIMSIEECYEGKFLNETGVKITIFLSIFDVHVNRSPVKGEIMYQEYCCGRLQPAYRESVGQENERHALGIENGRVRVLVTQIAGALARRIISSVTLGTELEQGQVYGMIKFGSSTEIVVPKGVEVLVKKGDYVKAGITVLGKFVD